MARVILLTAVHPVQPYCNNAHAVCPRRGYHTYKDILYYNAQFSGDPAFDAEGGGLFQDQEEAEQAKEDRLDDGVTGRTGAVAAADDANALFEGADP